MNNLQMSLGNSKLPLCFTLGKVELSFDDKLCKRCQAPKKLWIPPPGRTTKFCQCCFKKLTEPPTRFTVSIPANELLTSNAPFIIESSKPDNLKMLFLPGASMKNNSSQNTLGTSFVDKVLESVGNQKKVIEGAEKVLKENEKMRNTLSKNVKLLKKNMNDLQKNNKVSNEDKVSEEKTDVTIMSSTESIQTKSVATIAHRKKIKVQKKSTKETLRSEILRVENLLKNVQKLTESNSKKEGSIKVKTLETINTIETDQTDSGPSAKEDSKKNNIRTLSEKSTTYELIHSLQSAQKDKKNKAIQTSFLRPVPMIKFQPIKKSHNRKQNKIMKHRPGSIHLKKEVTKEPIMGRDKSIIEKFQNHATVENLMKKLADSMRRSKKLLDSIYRQDGMVESMQNKFIQQVENLYQEQQSMMKDLYDVSKSSMDVQTLDTSSSAESEGLSQQEPRRPIFPRGTKLEPSDEWIGANETYRPNFSSDEVSDEMHIIEKKLSIAQEKLSELRSEYNEMSKLLLNGSTTERKAFNKSATMNSQKKSADRSNKDSAYSSMNKTMPSENQGRQKADGGARNDIVYETVIKQTLRNVTLPELTQNNTLSPLAESIQNINKAVTQLLPINTNNFSGSLSEMSPVEGPLDSQDTPKRPVRMENRFISQSPDTKSTSDMFNGITAVEGPLDSQYFEDTPKRSSRTDKYISQSPVTKPPSERFNYTEKPSSLESFGPLSEYPFNVTDSLEESRASQRNKQGMDTSLGQNQSSRPSKNHQRNLEYSENPPRHQQLKKSISDQSVTENRFNPTSSFSQEKRLSKYHNWSNAPPQDSSTPKPGRLKTSDHSFPLSDDEDGSISNLHHHHRYHHHRYHHKTHQNYHESEHSPEQHTRDHAQQNLLRLRKKIDQLYEDIMK